MIKLFLLSYSILFFGLNAEKYESKICLQNPKIKSTTIEGYSVLYGDTIIGNKIVINYNDAGNRISSKVFLKDSGELKNKSQFTYNELGLITEEVYTKPDNEVLRRVEYTYDENNNLIYESHKSKRFYYLNEYLYNDQGTLLEMTQKDSTGLLQSKVIYKQTEKQTLEKIISFDNNGMIKNKILKKLDSNKNPIYSEWENSSGIIHSKYFSEFNDKGDKVKTIAKSVDGDTEVITKITTLEYKYDKFGNKIEEIIYVDEELLSKHTISIEYW